MARFSRVERAAIHELGHAIVAASLWGRHCVRRIVVTKDGLGYCEVELALDAGHESAVFYAGGCAAEFVTTGSVRCGDDLDQVRRLSGENEAALSALRPEFVRGWRRKMPEAMACDIACQILAVNHNAMSEWQLYVPLGEEKKVSRVYTHNVIYFTDMRQLGNVRKRAEAVESKDMGDSISSDIGSSGRDSGGASQ